jgi:hypothetical protein
LLYCWPCLPCSSTERWSVQDFNWPLAINLGSWGLRGATSNTRVPSREYVASDHPKTTKLCEFVRPSAEALVHWQALPSCNAYISKANSFLPVDTAYEFRDFEYFADHPVLCGSADFVAPIILHKESQLHDTSSFEGNILTVLNFMCADDVW